MQTENFDLTATAWVLVGTAPCVVSALPPGPALIHIGTAAPGLSSPYEVLRADDDDGFPVTASGYTVWARAFSGTARVVVSPIGAGGSGGGGGAANPYPGSDYAKTADFGTDGAAAPAIAGTGARGWLRAIYEKVAATLTVQGTVTANLGTLGGAAIAAKQDTGNTSLGSIDGKLGTAYGAPADSATTDIAANGAVFTFFALYKGTVANLLAIRSSLAGTLSVGGNTVRPSAGFTRPANTTAYAVGQLVANSTTAASVVALALPVARKTGGTGAIPRLQLKKSTVTLTAARFRVHLFRDAPVVAVGDSGVFSGNVSEAGYLGSFDVVMERAFSDGSLGIATPNTGSAAFFAAAAGSQSIQALIEARDAYTPGSAEVFTLTLDVTQD